MYKLFVNHKYADEAGVTIRLFFPGAKIELTNNSEDAHFLSLLKEDSAYAEVSHVGDVQAHFEWQYSKNHGFLTKPRMLMLALYHALQTIKPTYAPWGSLTGIRPTKLAREWQGLGLSDAEIISTYKDPYCVTEQKAKLALEVAKNENAVAEKIFGISNASIGFYINIPFCASRCYYCSFNCMDKPPTKELQELYVNALTEEVKEKASGEIVSSIYIGGGTPTFLSDDLLEKILCATEEVKSEKTTEFTVEGGRPDSVTLEKMRLLKRYGVTRFCINPQTLNDNTLIAIGRNHTADDFFKAFQIVREAGIKSISTDIIAGLPGETLFDMERTINGIIKLAPENITVHNLAIKRASMLKLGLSSVSLPSADTTQKMIAMAQEYLIQAGYTPYYLYRQKDMVGLGENVGYSQQGHECLYNVGMMSEVQTVIGTGAGAVSKYIEGSKISRVFNVKNPEVYVTRKKVLTN